MSSANGSNAVDHDPPARGTSLGGPSPSNDRMTTHVSRDAVHSPPAATTSRSWAMPIVSRARRSGRASAIAACVRGGGRLGGGYRIQHRSRLVGRLRVVVWTVGGGPHP